MYCKAHFFRVVSYDFVGFGTCFGILSIFGVLLSIFAAIS